MPAPGLSTPSTGAVPRSGPSMADDAATARGRRRRQSAFAHPPVAPDATAAYGDQPDQLVDFYRPGRAGAPGGPRRSSSSCTAVPGARRTTAATSRRSPPSWPGARLRRGLVEYRRGGDAERRRAPGRSPGRWPDTLDDVAAAVDALPALAVGALGAHGVDPRRIVLTGHCAGGHLALWAAARHVLPADSPWHSPTPPPLRGVVALAPIADFALARGAGRLLRRRVQFLGGPTSTSRRGCPTPTPPCCCPPASPPPSCRAH